MGRYDPMKVGILTYHFSDNYGALYQAYGLREWLRERGLHAEFINYHPSYVEEGGQFDRPWKPSLWRKNITIAYMKQAHMRRRLFGDRLQRNNFERFRQEILGVSGPRLFLQADVSRQISSFDMLICGSDQIWNPSVQRGLDPVYFLDIPGSERLRKVAYAPSFGRTEIEQEYNGEVRRMALGLDRLSVRETSGLEILKRAGVHSSRAAVVPDPTILLGKFDTLFEDMISPDNSVFCYALRTDEVIRKVATEAARLTGGQLKGPRTTHQRWSDIGEGVTPGPIEWLEMLSRSRVVVTNSFHGVALSIVLNRSFIAVGLPGRRASLNARVKNLLEGTGLQDRMLTSDDPEDVARLLNRPVDWDVVNTRLAAVRARAEEYLDTEIALAKAACSTKEKL